MQNYSLKALKDLSWRLHNEEEFTMSRLATAEMVDGFIHFVEGQIRLLDKQKTELEDEILGYDRFRN